MSQRDRSHLKLIAGGKKAEPVVRMEDVMMSILHARFPAWIVNGKPVVCIREISEQEFRSQFAIDAEHFPERILALALLSKETKEQIYELEEAPMLMQWFGHDAVVDLVVQIVEFSDLLCVVEDMGFLLGR